jgi:hypothetical protein
MLWGKKFLRIAAAVAVAIAAAHTAESRKGQEAQQSLLLTLQREAAESARVTEATASAVPVSASMDVSPDAGLGELTGITSVAATMPPAAGDHCRPSMQLTAVEGAMIHLSLSAPCNRNQRIVVRHSGLSFAVKTRTDGAATVLFPAMKPDATVAVYLADARLVLGKLAVPEVAGYARLAVMWEWPAEVALRVTDGDKVLVGTAPRIGGDAPHVMSLGTPDVQSPIMAQVYSVPGRDLDPAQLTGELRITPASCGRTLRLDTVRSDAGVTSAMEQTVPVPLCGTAGDILLLKNLGAPLTLDAPK